MAGLVRMRSAKGVHPAGPKPTAQLGPHLGEEPTVSDIGFRASDVNLAVRRVAISGHEHRRRSCCTRSNVPVLSAPLGEVTAYNRASPAVCPEVGGTKLALDVEP